MKCNYIIYQSETLYDGVKYFEEQGFTVKKEMSKNGMYGFVLFKEGPIIIIVEQDSLSDRSMIIKMRLTFGEKKKNLMYRYMSKKYDEGFLDISFYVDEFDDFKKVLKQNNIKVSVNNKTILVPNNHMDIFEYISRDISFPLISDKKIQGEEIIHKNGVNSIKKIKYYTSEKYGKFLNENIKDDNIEILKGRTKIEVIFC